MAPPPEPPPPTPTSFVPPPPPPPGNPNDVWLHNTLGFKADDHRTPGAGAPPPPPAPPDLAPAGSDNQSQEFRAALEEILSGIDANLAYIGEHAEDEKYQPAADKRGKIAAAYQAALGQIKPDDPGKSKAAIDKVLGAARGVAADIAKTKQAAEKDFNDWQSRQPKYDEAGQQIGEMQQWGHAKAPEMQSGLDGVKGFVDARAYAKASQALDAFLPKLKPAYDDYQTQKAAQAQYEPARQALDPRIAAAEVSNFHTLEPMQQEFPPAVQAIDAAVAQKDYVQALKLLTDLTDKVTEYEKKLAELQQQKQDFDTAKKDLQPKLDEAHQAPSHKTLDPMRGDIDAEITQMDQAEQNEDFKGALNTAKDLDGKADTYNQKVAELEQQKKEYEDVPPPPPERVAAAAQPSYKKLQQSQTDIADLNTKMLASVDEEDYVAAHDTAKDLSSKLDDYENSVKDLDKKKQDYTDARKDAQPSLDQAQQAPKHDKFAAMLQELTDGESKMDQAEQDEDFDTAHDMAKDLHAKADTYNQAVNELEQQKAAYEKALADQKIEDRFAAASQSKYKQLEAQQQELTALKTQMEGAVKEEDYGAAGDQLTQLASKLDAYEKALQEIEAHKQNYEKKRADMQKQLDAVASPPHPKLANEEKDIAQTVQSAEAAVADQNYESAEKIADDLKAKLDNYAAAVGKLEELRKQYTDACAPVLPRLNMIKESYTNQGKEPPQNIHDLVVAIEQLDKAEDYEPAIQKVGELAQAVQDMESDLANDEVHRVKREIEAVVTRGKGYLVGQGLEVERAVSDFVRYAKPKIKSFDGAPWTEWIDPIVSILGTAVSAAFPEAKGFVSAFQFASKLATAQIEKGKSETKDELEAEMDALASATSKAQTAVFNAEGAALSDRLTKMADADKKLWNTLAAGGDKEADDILAQIGIVDKSKKSLYPSLLKDLEVSFARSLARHEYIYGMKGVDRMVADSNPDDPSYKELHDKMDSAGKAAADQAGR